MKEQSDLSWIITDDPEASDQAHYQLRLQTVPGRSGKLIYLGKYHLHIIDANVYITVTTTTMTSYATVGLIYNRRNGSISVRWII